MSYDTYLIVHTHTGPKTNMVAQDSARVSYHCDKGSISAPCRYLINATVITCGKSVAHFNSTKYRRFSPSTPVSSCSNTEPMRGGADWTSRVNCKASLQG